MKLNELIGKSLSEVLTDMDIVKIAPCSDDNGEIKKIIIEYVPKNNDFGRTKPQTF